MRAPAAALLPSLALLAATPVLLPWSQGPIVTALAELWTVAVAGLVLMVLGVRAWRESPLQVAAFETPDHRTSAWPALLVGTAALAGLVSAGIAVVQVLAPQTLEGAWPLGIQPTHLPGRAVGHLRQPNHLATVLLWGAVAWAALHAQARIGALEGIGGLAVLMLAVVLTGSRTGLLGVVFLVAWAVADHRLPRPTRILLGLAPLMAAAAWWGVGLLSADQGLAFGAPAHLGATSSGDISSSRFAIWRNTWHLIVQQPWTGVGWGHFNMAWTLTPLSPRPPALFDHSHNLPLQLLVEWGVPLGGAIGLGLLALLFTAARRAWAEPVPPAQVPFGDRAPFDDGVLRRAALVMLGIVGLHSLLEYPLWYAYLGLPSLLALGVCMGWDRPWRRAARWPALVNILVGALMLGTAAWAWADYQSVRAIYEPKTGSGPLNERIAKGVQTTWFTDHAHYALATTVRPIPRQAWTPAMEKAFQRAPHVLLDPRLMMAWADALASRDGPDDRDRARYLAARLREFNSPAAVTWLKACEDPATPAWRHFVCETPERAWHWRSFFLR